MAYDKGYDKALIIEDDLLFYLYPFWENSIEDIAIKAPDDWNIIQLYSIKEKCNSEDDGFLKYNKNNRCWGTSVYLINRKGMYDVLNRSSFSTGYNIIINNNIKNSEGPADYYIYDSTDTYIYTKPIFLVGDEFLPSTIHKDHESMHKNSVNKKLDMYKKLNTEHKNDPIYSDVVDITKNGLFNTSYSLINKNGKIYFYGYGRNKNGHDKLLLKIISPLGEIIKQPEEITIPSQVKSTNVGEVKGFMLDNQFYVYTNFFGSRKSLDIFPVWATENSRELYFKSDYKNYLWNINTGKVIPLFYDILPGESWTNKNFLFFENRGKYLVITSVSPHRIYELDINTGYMKPYTYTNNKVKDFLGSEYRVNLSGGPIRIVNKGCYLVAGHISKGGWGGLRMTFFYTFRDSYPFDILSVSKPISFGFSQKLEYCNQMFEYKENIYLSIGIEDDYSVLLKMKLNDIYYKLSNKVMNRDSLVNIIWLQASDYVPNKRLIPLGIKNNYNLIRKLNKNINLITWDKTDIKKLIQQEYPEYIDVFNRIKDLRFLSDLSRLIILYHKGGYYIDIDQQLLKSFDMFGITDETDLVLARTKIFEGRDKGRSEISNGFIFVKDKKNKFIRKCLEEYILDLKKNNYEYSACKTMTGVLDNNEQNNYNILMITETQSNSLCPDKNCNGRNYWQSFYFTNKNGQKIMKSRYSNYHKDKKLDNINQLVPFD